MLPHFVSKPTLFFCMLALPCREQDLQSQQWVHPGCRCPSRWVEHEPGVRSYSGSWRKELEDGFLFKPDPKLD